MTRRNFQLLRVFGSSLRTKAEVNWSSRVQKGFICREEKRLHGGMKGDLETGGPVGQVWKLGYYSHFLYCPRVERSLGSSERSVSLADYHLLDLLQSALQGEVFRSSSSYHPPPQKKRSEAKSLLFLIAFLSALLNYICSKL
jgi:hypothetical protein